MKNEILLLGSSGKLGKEIFNYKKKQIRNPSKKELNILNKKKIEKYLLDNQNINLIIHCAALARVKKCERNKKKALNVNVKGTDNIVKSILKTNRNLKLVFISSDAVYGANRGNFKENDKLAPYNYYGKTKVLAEKKVKNLKKYMIIRTRFFSKKNIPFNYSATNIFTSSLEINVLVKYIFRLIKKDFNGTINLGRKKISDFKLYKRYKKKLIPCDKKKIFNQLKLKIATDASLNLMKMKKIL